jgi:hypothetical protein
MIPSTAMPAEASAVVTAARLPTFEETATVNQALMRQS